MNVKYRCFLSELTDTCGINHIEETFFMAPGSIVFSDSHEREDDLSKKYAEKGKPREIGGRKAEDLSFAEYATKLNAYELRDTIARLPKQNNHILPFGIDVAASRETGIRENDICIGGLNTRKYTLTCQARRPAG